jgi:hypothetical protein
MSLPLFRVPYPVHLTLPKSEQTMAKAVAYAIVHVCAVLCTFLCMQCLLRWGPCIDAACCSIVVQTVARASTALFVPQYCILC